MVILSVMKTAISIADSVFDAAERMSRRMGMSRSEFYNKAVQAYVKRLARKGVKDALDAVYSSESSTVDPLLTKMQTRSLPREDW